MGRYNILKIFAKHQIKPPRILGRNIGQRHRSFLI